MKIQIKKLKENAVIPTRGSAYAAGYDLYACIDEAIEISNRIAPEHLELCLADPFEALKKVKNAGSVFLGRYTPESLGDYLAGPNHTLPTSGSARFSSPLSVDDFVKKHSYLYYPEESLGKVKDRVADFAEREGLSAHARAALVRFADGEEKSE